MSVPRVGVLGGSFDPIHDGHLVLAQRALEQVPLDEVWFVPASRPPHKPTRELAEARHRAAMLDLAIAGRTQFSVCTIELDDPGVRFSVDTMRMLRARHPDTTFWLLLGEDSLLELSSWRAPAELLRLAAPVVAPRPLEGQSKSGTRDVSAFGVDLIWLRGDPIDLSSSGLRAALARGQRPPGVPDAVLSYIASHGLYRTTGALPDGGGQ